MRIFIFIVVLIALIVTASIAVDEKPVRIKDDPRLQEKMRLDVRCEPLSYFCQLLADKTGVKIRVKRDIQDQNVTAFVKEITPYEAMRQVALLYGYYWEVGGDPGRHSYTLYRPLRRIREAEDLRNAEISQKDREFRDFIEEGVKLTNSSVTDLQKAFDEDPYRTSDVIISRETFRDLGCFSSSQRRNIWDMIAGSPDGEIQIPFKQLPLSLQDRLRKMAEADHAKFPDAYPDSAGIEDRSLRIARGGRFDASPWIAGMPVKSKVTYFGLVGMSNSGTPGNSLLGRKNPLGDYVLAELRNAGIDTSSYKVSVEGIARDGVSPESKSERIPIKFEEEKMSEKRNYIPNFTEILQAFSDAYDIPVFADDYMCRRKSNRSLRTTFPKDPNEAINEIEKEFDYASVSKDGYMRFRNKVWYDDEPYEAPKRLIEKWLAIKQETGEFNFFNLLEVAGSLNNFQILGLTNMRLKEISNPIFTEIWMLILHIDRMRFCASFSPSQMAITFDTGLPPQMMTYNQQRSFAVLLRDARPNLTDEELWNCRFRLGNLTTVHDVSVEDSRRSGDGATEPYRYTEHFITFTYVYAPGDEQSFNFHGKTEAVVIK